ncbi:MAG: methyltransferase domain-containing protein [Pseudomonadota bacterium]
MADARDWAGDQGGKWANLVETMDRQLAPAAAPGVQALAPQPGERIIDLGCGGGPTSLMLAEKVGAAGRVLGVDISPDLLGIARRRAEGVGHLAFAEADAGSHPFEAGGWDALYSRFGCMFFDDPPAAMANLRRALVPGGRAVLTVWAEPKRNPWAMLPARAAAEVLGPAEKMAPGAPGPFGWCEPAIFEPILAEAGFADVTFVEHQIEMQIGMDGSPDPVTRAVDLACAIGPLASRLRETPEAEDQVRPILAELMRPHLRDDAVWLPGVIRVIAARNP